MMELGAIWEDYTSLFWSKFRVFLSTPHLCGILLFRLAASRFLNKFSVIILLLVDKKKPMAILFTAKKMANDYLA